MVVSIKPDSPGGEFRFYGGKFEIAFRFADTNSGFFDNTVSGLSYKYKTTHKVDF